MATAISYQLVLDVRVPLALIVGRLGAVTLAPGRYLYTGSARRGLEARLARHLRRPKALRWHIDWLTVAPEVAVRVRCRSTLPECTLNRRTRGTIPVPGFGASDCRSGCGAHLKRIGPLPAARRSGTRR